MSKKRDYKLKNLHTLDNSDCFVNLIKEFMVGCKILEVIENRETYFIEDHNFEFVGVDVRKNDFISGIHIELGSPSLLIEREVDKKHFVISMCPVSGWTVYEVVYD